MANHISAVKRSRQNDRRRSRNQGLHTETKSAVKTALELIAKAGTAEEARKVLIEGERSLRKAASKGVIPTERASRKTSRLASALAKKFPVQAAAR
jgi:small subunit ribosomal protein S20